MNYEELTKAIIGCAYRVYNRMGYGYLESVYEKCMMIELNRAGLRAENQVQTAVEYEGYDVGVFYADILVEDSVIIELKSGTKIIQSHEVQLVNYLVATKKEVGLIINFGEHKVDVRRKVRDLKCFHN